MVLRICTAFPLALGLATLNATILSLTPAGRAHAAALRANIIMLPQHGSDACLLFLALLTELFHFLMVARGGTTLQDTAAQVPCRSTDAE